MALSGKRVLITGASRGIGEAAARAFAAKGARVAMVSRSGGRIAEIAKDIGSGTLALTGDMGRQADVQATIDKTAAAFGGIDILVLNAAVLGPIGMLSEADPSEWGAAIDINLKGVFYGMNAAIPVMLKRGGGTIITISSGAAHNAVEGWSAYCASKAGAYMLTRMAHHEFGKRGIRALGLSPGTVATQMQRDIKASGVGPVAQLDWSAHISPEWPAEALTWMATPEADAYLGQDISLRDEAIRKAVGLI